MSERDLRIEWLPLEAVKLDPENPRLNDGEPVAAVKASILQFGFRDPIEANRRTGLIEAGHTRWKAALEIATTTPRERVVGVWPQFPKVPVIWHDDDPETARAYNIASNRTGELAQWDDGKLAEQLQALQAMDADLFAATGWSDDDLGSLLASLQEETPAPVEEGDIPEVQEGPTRVQAGEVWACGRHRVMCGDSTDPGTPERLCGALNGKLILTSPPYGVGMEYEATAGFEETCRVGVDALTVFAAYVRTGGFAFVNFGDRFTFPRVMGQVYLECFQRLGWRWYDIRYWRRAQVALAIWNTTQPRAMSHMECLWTWQNGDAQEPVRDLSISKEGLWECDGGSDGSHPAMMATGIAQKALVIYTDPGDTVLDPFLGSGTTLIAAEQTGRTCYGVEILPKYCDVILARWEKLTGKQAERVS